MMRLAIDRAERDAHAIRSVLMIDGAWAGFVLERVGMEFPAGRYALELKPYDLSRGISTSRFDKQAAQMMQSAGSEHFGMIRLIDVPGRREILFHWGNFWTDSEGCLCGGASKMLGRDSTLAVGMSRDAYVRIYRTGAAAIRNGGAEIIVSEPGK